MNSIHINILNDKYAEVSIIKYKSFHFNAVKIFLTYQGELNSSQTYFLIYFIIFHFILMPNLHRSNL